jgi:hypothetical protein
MGLGFLRTLLVTHFFVKALVPMAISEISSVEFARTEVAFVRSINNLG